MKKRIYRATFFLLFFTLAPFAASAWGTLGHRIVGEMSESLLNRKAKKEITKLLGNSSIAMVANWGDEVRSDSLYDYTATWHYTNLESGLMRFAFDTLAVKTDNGQNIYRIIELTNHLKQVPNDTAMLKMLIHLVGDMHCPMHLGRAGDRGGNSIQITWFKSPANLHSLWDSALIDSQKLSYTEYANHLKRVNKLKKIKFNGQTNVILDWAYDAYANAQVVYDSADETGKPYEYLYHYKPLWEECLVKAAERLASLLNYIYQ
ncbi:endonuclease [Bacteroidia bacterium]|nr:endonuclease [Bacteroidia bacterium]GHT45982.1 endonuclease [Bacteroidia bacterium]